MESQSKILNKNQFYIIEKNSFRLLQKKSYNLTMKAKNLYYRKHRENSQGYTN